MTGWDRASKSSNEVAAMLAEAEATDLAEDEEFGEDERGDQLAPELATKRAAWPRSASPRSPSRPPPSRHTQHAF